MQVVDKIKALLDAQGIAYKSLTHAPTYTSEESAKVRGEALAIGAKAIVMKAGSDFSIFVISAAQKLDSKKIKKYLGVKKTRFNLLQPYTVYTTPRIEVGLSPNR